MRRELLGVAVASALAIGCGGRTSQSSPSEIQARVVDAGTDAPSTCSDATPSILSDHAEALAIALDDTRVYWLDSGYVRSISKGGGPVADLAFSKYNVAGLAVDDTSVYWVSDAAELMRTPKGGGFTTTLVPADSSIGPGVVRIGADYLYWIASQRSPDAKIMRTRKDGTGTETLLSGRHFNDIALDEASIYFATLDGVGKLALAGGSPVDLAQDTRAWVLALDATDIYWYSLMDDIKKVPKAGGVVTTVVPSQEYGITSLAVGDAAIFFGTASGKILRAPKAGGPVTNLATGQRGSLGLALDADAIYWVNEGTPGASDGNVMKMCRAE